MCLYTCNNVCLHILNPLFIYFKQFSHFFVLWRKINSTPNVLMKTWANFTRKQITMILHLNINEGCYEFVHQSSSYIKIIFQIKHENNRKNRILSKQPSYYSLQLSVPVQSQQLLAIIIGNHMGTSQKQLS